MKTGAVTPGGMSGSVLSAELNGASIAGAKVENRVKLISMIKFSAEHKAFFYEVDSFGNFLNIERFIISPAIYKSSTAAHEAGEREIRNISRALVKNKIRKIARKGLQAFKLRNQ